jgi:hypothetical protein
MQDAGEAAGPVGISCEPMPVAFGLCRVSGVGSWSGSFHGWVDLEEIGLTAGSIG